MKNTMYAALVALVAGCGIANAGDGNARRFYGDQPPLEVERPRLLEREVIEEREVLHPRPLPPPPVCDLHPLIPFCPNEATKCLVVPGKNPYTTAIIVVFGLHNPDGIELPGENSPDMGIVNGRVNRLKELGYCVDVSYKRFPPAPVDGPLYRGDGPRFAPDVIPGGGGRGWFGR